MRLIAYREFKPVDFSMLTMGVVYGIITPIVYKNAGLISFPGDQFVASAVGLFYIHTLMAVLATVGIYFGWQFGRTRKLTSLSTNGTTKSISVGLAVMCVFSVLTQYLYTLDYGGFLGYFEYNLLIRAASLETTERSSFSFLSPFGGFAVVSCLGYYGLILSKKRSSFIFIGFSFSLIAAGYFLYSSAGRIAILAFIASILAAPLMVHRHRFYTWFIGYFGIVIGGIASVYLLSDLLSLNASSSFDKFIVEEASFPISSFFGQIFVGSGPYYFLDVLLSPAYLLPSSLTQSWLSSADVYNTIAIMGARKGENGVTGGIPTDLITFGFMQFNFVGVLIYGVIVGALIRWCYTAAQSFKVEGLRSAFTSYVFFNISAFVVFYSQPKHLLVNQFAFIASVMGVFFWATICKPILKIGKR